MARRRTRPAAGSTAELARKQIRLRGWSGATVGERMVPPVSRQRMNDVLSGRRTASVAWWRRVAAVLQVPASALGLDEPEPAPAPELPRLPTLVLFVCPGGLRAPTSFAPNGEETRRLLEQLGYSAGKGFPPDGPEWRCLVQRAAAAGVAIAIRPAPALPANAGGPRMDGARRTR